MVGDGRSGKAGCHKPDMHASGKSDDCIVPVKPLNKGSSKLLAEVMEGRRPKKRLRPVLRTEKLPRLDCNVCEK